MMLFLVSLSHRSEGGFSHILKQNSATSLRRSCFLRSFIQILAISENSTRTSPRILSGRNNNHLSVGAHCSWIGTVHRASYFSASAAGRCEKRDDNTGSGFTWAVLITFKNLLSRYPFRSSRYGPILGRISSWSGEERGTPSASWYHRGERDPSCCSRLSSSSAQNSGARSTSRRWEAYKRKGLTRVRDSLQEFRNPGTFLWDISIFTMVHSPYAS